MSVSPSWPVPAQGMTFPLLSQHVVWPVAGRGQPAMSVVVVVLVVVLVVVVLVVTVVLVVVVLVVVGGAAQSPAVQVPLQH